LMEVNPRLWGSLALPIDCGVDFPRGLAALATGMPLLPQPKYRTGRYTRSLLDDVSWLKENLRADHGDPLLMTRSRIASVLQPVRVFFGRESWDHFTRDDVAVGRRVLVDIVREHAQGLRRRAGHIAWKIAAERRHESKFRDPRRLPRPVKHILFLCYGNICRSPFAEYVARELLPEYTISSSGFHTRTGRASPTQIQVVAKEMGYDQSEHRSSRVTREDIDTADLILLMDHDNWRRFYEAFPDARGRTTLLGLYADPPRAEIEDPYAEGEAHTRHALGQIQSGIQALAKALAGSDASG
jgi:protein-tyrosine-phosphatase